MADFKFCPDCGEKIVAKAQFCVGCGRDLKQHQGNFLVYLVIGGLALAALVVAFIKYGLPETNHTEGTTTTQVAEHKHDDPPNLIAARETAANGDAAALMNLAEIQISLGKDRHYLAEAAETVERIVRSYPQHAYSLRLLANIYYDLSVSDRALDYYGRYLAIVPEDANAHVDMGTQLLALKRTKEAISQYEKACEIFPDFYNAHYNLSIAYKTVGDEVLAKAHEEKAREIATRVGKKLAPDPELSRLPEGVAEKAPPQPTRPSGPDPERMKSEGIDYAPLYTFFSLHQIIAPKIADFSADGGKAVLKLNQFPMDRMPPMVRGKIELKIRNMLKALDDKAVLELWDAADGRVMATYRATDT